MTILEPYGGVAQLGEHLPCKQGVRGSNPLISTFNTSGVDAPRGNTRSHPEHDG